MRAPPPLLTTLLLPLLAAAGASWLQLGLERPEAGAGAESVPESEAEACSLLGGGAAERLCRLHADHVAAARRAARAALQECQWQFRQRRWNCSTAQGSRTVFGPVSRIPSREMAFAHALSAASLLHAVARACHDGQLAACGCSRRGRPRDLHASWLWGGCGDNLHYGYKFSTEFADANEREKPLKKGSREAARAVMNLHNNEAGRRAVVRKSRVACKCHGVSGSCSLITCWQQLAPLREVGDYLKDKYDGATEVRVTRRGRLAVRDRRFSRPTSHDLVYLAESPDYCERNDSLRLPGTYGRQCNRTSQGIDGCSLLCCGRGYNTQKTLVRERCRCKFRWCCSVECKVCSRTVDVHTCK
ncbi:protein Wnt-5b-like [Schistocerca gregaria]|uniref:protein Wnt-5b-like n=1 Tax=Schistocerca gregaria TaxID=7010 RepID=UPI00211EBF32|nr:protein Wnt-5b-like [Schistocerca gregaria]